MTCAAQNVNHAYVGYVNLLPFPLQAFATVAMNLPPGLQTVFQNGCSNLQLGIALSVSGGGPYLLDNFRVNPVVAPPTASILGMERTLDWTATSGSLTTSSLRTQGQQGLSITGFTYTAIRGAPVAVPGLVSNQVGVDVMVPSLPSGTWPGQTQLFLSAPAEGINNVYLGQVSLAGFQPNQFQTAVFTVPPTVMQSLQVPVTDLSVSVTLNVASTPSPYRLDNVRFNPARAACAFPDTFAPPMSGANWLIYDTGTPGGTVSSTPGIETLASRGGGFSSAGDGILFFYQPTSGDIDVALSLKVPSQSGASAGIMIRSALTPTAPFVFMGTANGRLALVSRVSGTQVTTVLGNAATGTVTLRLVKAGLTVSGFSSVDGLSWQSLGSATFAYDGELNVGPVAASGSSQSTVAASFNGLQLLFAGGCGRCGDGG